MELSVDIDDAVRMGTRIARNLANAHAAGVSRAPLADPAFMSPEQIADRPVGPPADIYALGVLLYAAVAGRPPFEHDDVGRLLRAHLGDDALPVRIFRRDCPARLAGLIHRCLHKAPGRRPTAMEVVDSLEALRRPSSDTAVTSVHRP